METISAAVSQTKLLTLEKLDLENLHGAFSKEVTLNMKREIKLEDSHCV